MYNRTTSLTFEDSMPADRLKELLQDLNTELDSQSELDSFSKEQLEVLVGDIKKHLDPAEAENDSIGASVEQAVHNFEESHPKIAKTLTSIVDTLNSLGI
ncbi:MAG: DUF4404 family protein [Fibrobacterales bacterium]